MSFLQNDLSLQKKERGRILPNTKFTPVLERSYYYFAVDQTHYEDDFVRLKLIYMRIIYMR